MVLSARTLALTVLAALLAAGTALARPMTFLDLVEIQTPGGLAISPDGKLLAVTVSGRNLEENRNWSQLQVLNLKKGELVRVTAGGSRESSPSWGPGNRLAFISNKSETPQVWLVEAPGGEARQLTALSTGAGAPRFSKDGKTIYFTSTVFPDCATDECNRSRSEAEAANPVKARLFTKLMYRHFDHWRDGTVDHVHAVDCANGTSRDLMVGHSWGVTGEWAVSLDGGWLYFTSKDPEKEELSTNNDLFRLALSGQDDEELAAQLLTPNPAHDATPILSPDGKWLSWHSHVRPGFESDLLRLTVQELGSTGKPFFLGDGLDRPVMQSGWFPDSKELWFAVEDRGSMALYRVDRKKNKPAVVIDRTFVTDIALSPDGKTFYAVRHSLSAGPEVWSFPAKKGTGKPLTNFNGELFGRFELAAVEDFWWEGADGDKVHGYLLFPPGTSKEKKNPFLLVIHGGPQGAWGDALHPRWNAQLFAAPGYVTLLANPRGSTGYGQRFTDQISRDWGGKVYEDLMSGVDALVAKGWIDEQRMCAAGGSYGGYMANWLEANTERFKCLISHAGVYDLKSKYGCTDELWFPEWEFGGTPWESEDYDKWSPSNFVRNFRTPMLIIHGAHDYRVAESQAMQLFTALQRQGVPSTFLYFPDETHFVAKPKNSQLWYATFHDWLAQWIGQ